jgi:hypothetical protein
MMEEQMVDHSLDMLDVTPRRSFFGRVAGAMALGVAGFGAPAARAQQPGADGPDWPGALKGRHRQVVDGYEVNAGGPLAFAYTFMVTNPAPGAASAVVILRHGAFPLALNNAMWAKYKIGPSFNIIDPETKAPAVKNPYLNPKPGILVVDDMAIDRLIASGAMFGACNIALLVQSKKLAENAGVSADEAAKEWAANVVPSITVIPSGTWGLNRAQEGGCTYCAGG